MAFKLRNPRETEAEEVARLGAAPEGSTTHGLSLMPVLNPLISRGMVFKLTDSRWIGHVVVVAMEHHSTSLEEGATRDRHDGSWRCMVIGGTNKTYSPGCWDIDLATAELARSERVML